MLAREQKKVGKNKSNLYTYRVCFILHSKISKLSQPKCLRKIFNDSKGVTVITVN